MVSVFNADNFMHEGKQTYAAQNTLGKHWQ